MNKIASVEYIYKKEDNYDFYLYILYALLFLLLIFSYKYSL